MRLGASAHAFDPSSVHRILTNRPRGLAVERRDESTDLRGRRTVSDVDRGHVVAAEIGRHAGRKLRGIQFDVAIDAGGESVVNVSRRLLEQLVGVDGSLAGNHVLEIHVELRAPVNRDSSPRAARSRSPVREP